MPLSQFEYDRLQCARWLAGYKGAKKALLQFWALKGTSITGLVAWLRSAGSLPKEPVRRIKLARIGLPVLWSANKVASMRTFVRVVKLADLCRHNLELASVDRPAKVTWNNLFV